MKHSYQHTTPTRRSSLLTKVVAILALAVTATLAGCAYTQTMNERNAEGERLRREFEYEQQRHRDLSR